MVVRVIACGNISMRGGAWSSAKNPLWCCTQYWGREIAVFPLLSSGCWCTVKQLVLFLKKLWPELLNKTYSCAKFMNHYSIQLCIWNTQLNRLWSLSFNLKNLWCCTQHRGREIAVCSLWLSLPVLSLGWLVRQLVLFLKKLWPELLNKTFSCAKFMNRYSIQLCSWNA